MSAGAAGLPALQPPAWMPPELAAILASAGADIAPMLQGLLGFLPAVAGGVTVLLWVVWAFGALPLLAIGVALHIGIALWRRRRAATARAATGRFTAGATLPSGLPR